MDFYRNENGVTKYYPQGVPNDAPCEVVNKQIIKPKKKRK